MRHKSNYLAFILFEYIILQHMTDIDKIDRRILRELELDGRISNADLATRVGLSPSACLRRVQELERRKIILGYKLG